MFPIAQSLAGSSHRDRDRGKFAVAKALDYRKRTGFTQKARCGMDDENTGSRDARVTRAPGGDP